jgi:hypothetical protein
MRASVFGHEPIDISTDDVVWEGRDPWSIMYLVKKPIANNGAWERRVAGWRLISHLRLAHFLAAFNWCQSTGLSTDVRVMVDSKFAEPGV